MFKCKYCDKEFENKGHLLAHYREHKAEEASKQTEEETADAQEKAIPLEFCPPEVKLLGEGRYLRLHILGMKKGDKLIIQDIKLV